MVTPNGMSYQTNYGCDCSSEEGHVVQHDEFGHMFVECSGHRMHLDTRVSSELNLLESGNIRHDDHCQMCEG